MTIFVNKFLSWPDEKVTNGFHSCKNTSIALISPILYLLIAVNLLIRKIYLTLDNDSSFVGLVSAFQSKVLTASQIFVFLIF